MTICQLVNEDVSKKHMIVKATLAAVVIFGTLYGLNETFWTSYPLVPLYLVEFKGSGAIYIRKLCILFVCLK
jgi:ABC-type xylose transport system permease subunit